MTMPTIFGVIGLGLLVSVAAQSGSESYSSEGGPDISLRKCKSKGSCKKETVKLTIDANWRWVHVQGDYKNCYKGNLWIEEYCPGGDGKACAQKCQLEGVSTEQYKGTYGVTSIKGGEGVQMKFVNKHEYGVSVGSRLYMYKQDKYEMFYVVNQEFAFTFNMKELECGMNGAVYFIEMQDNGGKGIGNNDAGAKFGTGYCDAQCPHDIKFIDGEANIKDWKPNPKDKSGNMGTGHYGACCNEMDIWEANSRSNAFTPHPCEKPSMYRCEGTECGDNDKGERYKGVCDKDGCDFANVRVGARDFYGKGSKFEVDTAKDGTQVTQFVTHNGKDDGDLIEIRRVWTQGGKVIKNSGSPHLKGCIGEGDTLSDDFCKSQNEKFGDYNHFKHHGGNKVMGESLKRGHVLAISLWDDVDVSMMWLDSWFPRNKDPTEPGVYRGPCEGGESSTPMYVRQKYPDNKVQYWDFAVGCLGCTTEGVDAGPPVYENKCDPAPGASCKEKECEYKGGRSGKGGDGGRSGKGDDGGRSGKGDESRRRSGKGGDDGGRSGKGDSGKGGGKGGRRRRRKD